MASWLCLSGVATVVACAEPAPAQTAASTTDTTAAGADASGSDCAATDASGTVCDDGNPCTIGDTCTNGTCKGTPKPCDDGLACTADTCAAKGDCDHAQLPATCRIGGKCYAGGQKNPTDVCLACAPTASAVQWSAEVSATCDDGSACTAMDRCSGAGQCVGVALVCDDKNVCTTDTCDAKTGCAPKPLTGASCEDGNKCITGDTCQAGVCKPGVGSLPCDDGNGCTLDSCAPGQGCIHGLTKAPCNDGAACTMPDLCTGGTCVGVKTGLCPKCKQGFGPTAGKLTVFQIGTTGHSGDGLDVDGNPKTCAPSTNCSAGIDNAASVLAAFVNKPLISAVLDGKLSFIADFAGYVGEGKPFTLNLFYAEQTPASIAAKCAPLLDACEWGVGQAGFAGDCTPKFSFSNAMIKGGKLTAGGKGTLFAMDADLIGAKNATLYVKGARMEGSVEMKGDATTIQNFKGVLAGAVPKEGLVDMINALDQTVFDQLKLDKATVLLLLDDALELDLDIDGDGKGDAASIGIRFSGVGAKLLGTNAN
ncbi:MAG: hypothetical protein EXR79_08065 [Myxococcales bacterium]|nr:hypothetical protein [Myxococcales bacterium]